MLIITFKDIFFNTLPLKLRIPLKIIIPKRQSEEIFFIKTSISISPIFSIPLIIIIVIKPVNIIEKMIPEGFSP